LVKVLYSAFAFSMTTSNFIFLFINIAMLMKIEQSERIYFTFLQFLLSLLGCLFAIESHI
jgi:uncharacterized membrane protein YcgQ (UPF0703/DUF1980 family)